jgi:hypothetical protein
MSTLFYVVLIVAVVVTADTVQKIYKMRHEERAANDDTTDEELERLSQLEERIRVLERIVTEDKHDLRREINRL